MSFRQRVDEFWIALNNGDHDRAKHLLQACHCEDVEQEWYVQYLDAKRLFAQRNDAAVAKALFAYNMRPRRAEPLYALITHCRQQGLNRVAYLFLQQIQSCPVPNPDELFVEEDIHEFGIRYETSSIAYYVGESEEGLRACSELMLRDCCERSNVLKNMLFYVNEIRGALHYEINYPEKPFGWNALNPGLCENKQELVFNMRLVNSGGDWFFLNKDLGGMPVSEENPICTKNARVTLDPDNLQPSCKFEMWQPDFELHSYGGWVKGLEDIRLFSYRNKVWFLATAREFTPDHTCAMVLGNDEHAVVLRSPKSSSCTEKNWLPFVVDNTIYIVYNYEPFTVLKMEDCKTGQYQVHVTKHYKPLCLWSFRGSAPPVFANGNFYFIIHEVGGESNTKRVYTHRVIKMNPDFEITHLSLPFVMLGENPVEYISGLVIRNNLAYIAWGDNDSRAMLSTVGLPNLDAMCLPLASC
jgi:hypothetical protein